MGDGGESRGQVGQQPDDRSIIVAPRNIRV